MIAFREKGPAVLFWILVILPVSVWGHSFPNRADPRVGSTTKTSPPEVTIWFDAGIEPLFSTIEVFDSNHQEVDKKDSHIVGNDNTLFAVSIPALPPGKYQVHWSVISVDTHHTEGTFNFWIGG